MAANADWLFLSNHGAVLLCIAGNPTIDTGELARLLLVGEPTAEAIVSDLISEGYVTRSRTSRTARYEINRKAHFRHPLFDQVEIGPLIDALQETKAPRRTV